MDPNHYSIERFNDALRHVSSNNVLRNIKPSFRASLLTNKFSSVSLDEKPKDNFVATNGFTANVPKLKKLTRTFSKLLIPHVLFCFFLYPPLPPQVIAQL